MVNEWAVHILLECILVSTKKLLENLPPTTTRIPNIKMYLINDVVVVEFGILTPPKTGFIVFLSITRVRMET